MAETKQDRILETLKQRITQLEDELRLSKDRLHRAQNQNEETLKEMELLRAEAHDVVGQWEKEAMEVRKRLQSSELQVNHLTKALQEATASRDTLQNQVTSLEKVSAEYSTSIGVQQKRIELLEKTNAEMTQRYEKLQSEFAEAMQQTKEFEELTTAMQKELVSAAENEKLYVRDIESLRASLSHRTGEVETLRSQKDEISSQAEKLLNRINDLKALNDQLCGDSEISQQRTKVLMVEVENLKLQLTEANTTCKKLEEQLARQNEDSNELSNEVDRLKKMAADADAISQQQLEIIAALEKDVQELQDTGIVQGKFLEEYQQQRETLENELADAVKAKEEAETQFTTIKECYSTALVEANDYKNKMESRYKELAAELEKHRAEMADALRFSDHRCEAAMDSVRQLNNSLQNFQVREALLLEQAARQEIELACETELVSYTRTLAQSAVARTCVTEAQLVHTTAEKNSLGEQMASLSEKHEALKLRAASTTEELSALRKSFATLEGKASTMSGDYKQLEEKNASLQRDNAWLKDQVEAMRTELGDLDELLNANLNQMQEENEKQLTHNHALQASVEELKEKGRSDALKLEQYEQSFRSLENEFAAQAKTLDIAEADLRAANEEIDKLQRTLSETSERVEEAEQRISELSRSNTLLSTQNNTMKEQLRGQEEKQNIIVADKRREIEALRVKINQYVEKAEDYAGSMAREKQTREELEKALSASKENVSKLRAALDELKGRCSTDAASLKQLINERDELLRDRDVIVERYNRLHDAFRNVKRETNNKVAEELRKMLEFSTQQENELQQLRSENITLKKSVSMFVTSAQPKAEAIFMERLNLTEGPLRHPKKRSVAKSSEPAQ